MGTFTVREALASEADAILAVQYDAFGRVASGLGLEPEDLPPLRESAEDLRRLMGVGMRFWVAVDGEGGIIGSVRGAMESGVVEIGRLVVAAGHTRKGVATALMDALESAFPDATRFALFTGRDARAPLALYEGRGYARVREEDTGSVVLVWLEKSPE